MTQRVRLLISGAAIVLSIAALSYLGVRQPPPSAAPSPRSLRTAAAPRVLTFSQFYAELTDAQRACFSGEVGERRSQVLSSGNERVTDAELEILSRCLN